MGKQNVKNNETIINSSSKPRRNTGAKDLTPKTEEPERDVHMPFKDRAEFEAIADILNRKYAHHIALCGVFNAFTSLPYVESLLDYLIQHDAHKNIYYPELWVQLTSLEAKSEQESLTDLLAHLKQISSQQLILFENMLPYWQDSTLRPLIIEIVHHPLSRLITFKDNSTFSLLEHEFSPIKPSSLAPHEHHALIHYHLAPLIEFHQVNIPEIVIPHALYLARRFLPAEDKIKNTLLLLDSAAARVKHHAIGEQEPHVTIPVLNDVISCLTQVPATHLQRLHFNPQDFYHAMQQDIAGQDEAILAIAKHIQRALISLQLKTGPMLSLLFTGCRYSGKKTMAFAMVKHLFEQQNIIYIAKQPFPEIKSIADLKFIRYGDNQTIALKQLILQIPYAVIFIEDCEKLPTPLQKELQAILTSGFLPTSLHLLEPHETFNKVQYDFHQAIFILSTTEGANYLATFIQDNSQESTPSSDPFDLIQLVKTNERKEQFLLALNSMELLTDTLARYAYAEHAHLIPFLPLTKAAIENIIFKKLKSVSEQLQHQHKVELAYAPEVIHYLTDRAQRQQNPENGEINIDQAFEVVYQVIETMVFQRKPPKTIFLQLNESGELLRCA